MGIHLGTHPIVLWSLLIFWCLTHGHVLTALTLIVVNVLHALSTIRMVLEERGQNRRDDPALDEDLRRLYGPEH